MKRKVGSVASVLLLAVVVLIAGPAAGAQSPQIPIAGSAIPQFVQPLPLLSVSGGTMSTVLGNQPLTITMCEFDSQVLPPPMPPTRTWGYIVGTTCPTTVQDTYIGPVIVNNRGSSTPITWVNDLGTAATTGVLAYKYSTDQTLHWADPVNMGMNMCNHMAMYPMFGDVCAQNYGEAIDAPIPAVTHLHGGEVPPEIDGGPDAWFTSDGMYRGTGYYSFPGASLNASTYNYPNTQEAGPLWFHDHTLGATRLNVYAGLAGAYFIQDPALNLPANLQPLTEVVPLVLQDRMFDTNGQFFFQADSAGAILWATNPEHPYWSPEFVGDSIVINGKAWPFLNVMKKRYRFLFLNGSNARTYEMFLVDPVTKVMGPPMWVIGTDGGYLDSPVKIDPKLGQKLVMMPGERYEVILDFNDPTWLAGFTRKTGPFSGTLILNNNGRTPYPGGTPPQGSTLGQMMKFVVGAVPAGGDTSYNPASGIPLRTGTQAIKRLVNPATGTLAVTAQKTRQLTLNEVMGMPMTAIDPVTGVLTNYPGGPLEILVNNTKWSGERTTGVTGGAMSMYTMQPIPGYAPVGENYISELPKEGDTEVWEIVNLTADAHPIHLHLVQFQLINRQMFNVNTYTAAYNMAFPGSTTTSPAFDITTGLPCAANMFCPGYGPPKDYDPALNPLSGGKFGGNPDIGATKMIKGKMTPLYLQGNAMPPLPNEAGWKDTVIMLPGQVTRIAVRYAPTDLATNTAPSLLSYPFDPNAGSLFNYVWHCHIIDHEDNEMMRPTSVLLNPLAPAPLARPLVKGLAY